MPSSEVQEFFDRYVLPPRGTIYGEIKREIDLARSGEHSGGFLSALGLLSYTEFMGGVLLQGDGSYTKQFKVFFRRMGAEYARLIDSKDIDVYRVFRSGIVQSVLAKECEIKTLNDGGYSAGIVVDSDGKLLFVVEKYFEDFLRGCELARDEMSSYGDVFLPFE